MTVRGLLDFFENYYGEKYTGVFLEVMTEYLNNFSDDYLEALSKTMVLKYPRSFNKSPDPAILEKYTDEIYNEIERRKLKFAIPERPTEICTPEEAEIYINQMREILNTNSPMSISLNEMINNLG
ncbi:MAG: hypothetical protein FWB73_00190 [Treponema sp.]|nr:hypothetical protein [Treponema sp.]